MIQLLHSHLAATAVIAAVVGLIADPLRRLVLASARFTFRANDYVKHPLAHTLLVGSERAVFTAVRAHRQAIETSLHAVAGKYGVPARLIHAGVQDFLDCEPICFGEQAIAPQQAVWGPPDNPPPAPLPIPIPVPAPTAATTAFAAYQAPAGDLSQAISNPSTILGPSDATVKLVTQAG